MDERKRELKSGPLFKITPSDLRPIKPGVPNYNWRNTLLDFAAISGVFAGFTITLIVLILAWSLANTPLVYGITWGNVGVLLSGISTVLFIAASQFFLGSKEFDMWALSKEQRLDLKKQIGKDWENTKKEMRERCIHYEKYGRHCYNFGLLLWFLSLLFVVWLYSWWVALSISGLGVVLETYQVVIAGRRKKQRLV